MVVLKTSQKQKKEFKIHKKYCVSLTNCWKLSIIVAGNGWNQFNIGSSAKRGFTCFECKTGKYLTLLDARIPNVRFTDEKEEYNL